MTAPRLGAGGTIAGKYTVRSLLGDSGSVLTYHCVNPSGQEVAVKVYDPAVASHAAVMKALEQAYAATNALPANSSAPIIDAGYDQATIAPFSVTEIIRLPSLLAQQRRFSPEEVVALLKGLARSLDLAHLRQVVHGALKPSNIFVGPSANPTVVTDFAANLPKAAIPTAEGYALSAPWIAPEQAQSGQATPAVDVFSTALVAFFALTGRSYWRSCQGPQLDLAGWQAELVGPRTPASARAAEMGVPLSPSMDMVLFRALSVDAKDRYRSIGEFATTLEESMRQQVGSAATMALPLVGEAPSPLPPNMQKPPPNAGLGPSPNAGMPGPALGGVGAATMALPLSAILPGGGDGLPVPPAPPPPNAGFDPRMSQSAAPRTGSPPTMGMPMPMAPDAAGGGGSTVLGMQMPPGMAAQAQSWNPGQPQNPYGNQGYSDPGYPPPPGPNGASAMAKPAKKSKAIPIIIAVTAVAVIAGVILIFVLKSKNSQTADNPTADTSSATAANNGTTSGGAADPPKPTSDAAKPATTDASSSTGGGATTSGSAAPSASVAPVAETIEITFKCTADPDVFSVDGNKVECAKMQLEKGPHTISIAKAGYNNVTDKIDVKESKEITYKLTPVVTTTNHPPPPCKKTLGHPCPH